MYFSCQLLYSSIVCGCFLRFYFCVKIVIEFIISSPEFYEEGLMDSNFILETKPEDLVMSIMRGRRDAVTRESIYKSLCLRYGYGA